jgi:hypothetical protein
VDGVGGTAVGTGTRAIAEVALAALVHDAITSGQTVLLAETHGEAETSIAREVIKETFAECRDVSIA